MKIGFSNLVFILILVTCQNAFCIERLSIDSFDEYLWDPQGGSLPVESHKFGDSNQGMLLRCDFSKKQDRCTWDRNTNLDLTRYGRFSLKIYAEDPSAIRSGTLYFQSGNGWYVAKLPVERKGWKKMSILKGNFYMEGSPTGWHSINKIRFSFWKSGNSDTVVIVDDFEAIADDIVVVMGNLTAGKSASDARLVRDYHRTLSKILDDSGLDFEIINDTDVESNALSGRKIAIFPYNTYMSDKEIAAIEDFVNSGGKIMLFYSFPEKLGKLIGIELTGWEKEEPPGRFSYIVFDQKGFEGLPESIYQGSWNIRTAKPIGKDTKIAGYWADGQASKSEIPALMVSPNGTFMGHILLPNDMFSKRLMFLALFYHIAPDMGEYLSQLVLKNAGKLAGFDDFSHTFGFIQENLEKIPKDRRVKSLEHLEESKKSLAIAQDSHKKKLYANTLNMVQQVSHELTKAFFTSLPSKPGEFRAVWGNSVMGTAEWDWDKTVRHLKENGFNAIFPNMLRAGVAYYPSKILPEAPEIKGKSDRIANCIEACDKYGVQVHIWKVNWYLSRAPKEFVDKMRKEGRLQRDRYGNEVDWLCPSNRENQTSELQSILEVVRKYDIDGIHLDYIRYPDQNSCFCNHCKEGFEKSKKIKIKNWPEDVISGKYKDDFIQWRCNQITRLVKSVSDGARKLRPKIKVSAAVFKDYPECRFTVGQDWKHWIDKGYLDFVCPMNYTINNDQFSSWVINQSKIVNKRIPIYPGIGYSSPGLPPEQTAMQAYIARELGMEGFVIFSYDSQLAKNVLPEFSKGLTSNR